MPRCVTECIYPKQVDMSNAYEVIQTADRFVCQCKCDGLSLVLYVTGAQIPLLEVISACKSRGVHLTLMMYRPMIKAYVKQELVQDA